MNTLYKEKWKYCWPTTKSMNPKRVLKYSSIFICWSLLAPAEGIQLLVLCAWTNICYILPRHTCQHRESPNLRELHMLSWLLWSAQCARFQRNRYRGRWNPVGCSPGFQAGNGSISSLTLEYTHRFWMLLSGQWKTWSVIIHWGKNPQPVKAATLGSHGHLMETAFDSVTSPSMSIWWCNLCIGAFEHLPGHSVRKESHPGMSSVLKLDYIEAL